MPPFYDSLLGKLVVWDRDRPSAIARARAALDEMRIEGLATSLDFHRSLVRHPTFLEGRFTTNLLDRVGSAAFAAVARP
jgi:acetyl-CoA carboxylase biotin carboxylase subunit